MGPRWIGIGGCQGGLRLFAFRHAEHHSAGDEMRTFSAPPFPDCGISFAMKDRQNDDRFGFPSVVNAIWKALQRHTPNVYMDDWRKVWMLRYECDATIDFGDEFDTEINPSLFVPEGRFV
jgi:hypothetical protein